MTLPQHKITILHERFGYLLSEVFLNQTQFKLFLKMVQGSLELKNDLTFFNGNDFLVHVPHKYLVESIILTSEESYSLSDHFIQKSKIESIETK
jgi:hypothetical protein